jgi:outer membrane lipase/esterase
MPRTKILASALALALGGTSVAHAQSFSGVIVFGDSLSDAGQYAALPAPFAFGSGSFTTNPDDVWTQIVAAAYGANTAPSNAGGTNYAWGGAPTSFAVTGVPFPLGCVPTTLPCRSVSQQIAASLAATGGQADPNALYTYWAGANDLFNYLGAAGAGLITSAQVQQFTGASAMTAVGQINALQTAGANTIVVMNLPDIGMTPGFRGTPNQTSVSGLVFAYNSTLNAGLGTLADGIVPINVYGLFNEILANPETYGFTNVTAPACNLAQTNGSSLFCSTPNLVAAGANQTYAFADGVHPSGAAHAIVANVVLSTLAAPGQVSLAAEVPLRVYDDHSGVVNWNIFGMDRAARDPGESNVYGSVQFDRQEFEASANTNAFDNDAFVATLGADVRWQDRISVGAAVSLGVSNGDTWGAAIDTKEVLLSGYGVAHFGRGYLNAILSGGSSNIEIDRSIEMGPATRIERGSTSAAHVAAEIGGGFNFGGDGFRHGPYASLTWQKVDVDGYAEDGNQSTAMYFSDFNRKSEVIRVGYRAQGDMGGFSPFARVAWAKDNQEAVTAVQAGSNTMNGHFTLDGFIPAEDWIEADLGLSFAISDATSINASYRARLSDDTQDVQSINLGFRTEFGGAPAPVDVVEVVEAAPTCSDLDDDGDGVNNCDDKCPTTPAGEAVGADGCPVPAAEPEPEPVMEPKPYRN